jgi:phosphoglycolate phosphatase-like HAD superfamily hydrolase
MKISSDQKLGLFVTDIDNTLFDWVSYYVPAIEAMFACVNQRIGVEIDVLAAQAREVFSRHGSIEYPFVVQELPAVIAHYGPRLDLMLQEVVDPAREEFKRVGLPLLRTYDGVDRVFAELRERHPDTPIVALTDAPRYVAMWKLNKLGILHHFSAIYGLADPRLPTDRQLGRVKVDPKILLKHLQQENYGYQGRIRILPDEYEKPGTRGLKTVLMDYEIDDDPEAKARTVWVGDNLRKDVGLGKRVGVRTFWAKYGVEFPKELLSRLHAFSPLENIQKNISLDADQAPTPDVTLSRFADVLAVL